MSAGIKVTWDASQLEALKSGPFKSALRRALRKAGPTAQRDMRSEASKRVRALKAIKVRFVTRAFTLKADTKDLSNMTWSLDIDGQRVPLGAYPVRQTKKGVSVEVNRGKRTVVKRSFKATMASGHSGVFQRKGTARLPIRELVGSRPIDVLQRDKESGAVAERGAKSFMDTFERLLPLELEKGEK